MSRIRMRVLIRNESDATLSFVRGEVSSGSYTPDWYPPPIIKPGERKGFQGEGDLFGVPTSGTEGRVYYNIVAEDGGGELYIHWNSPLMESPYGNTFHIWAPPGWEVTHWGGQGHRAELEIRLRRTAPRYVPNFKAPGRGFAFSNSNGAWSSRLPVISLGLLWNKLFDSLPDPLNDLGIDRVVDENAIPITRANMGMCGGMVFTVMDYYAHHLLPPDTDTNPSSANDPLFLYIRDRLWDSFDVTGQGYRFLAYASPHYPNGDEGVLQNIAGLAKGRSWITYREEFPRIQADIDAGRLSPVGLVQTDSLDIGQNHTVLAYGYRKDGQNAELFIYDPNIDPDVGPQEVTLAFDLTHTNGKVRVRRRANPKGDFAPKDDIQCFFRINNYVPKMPPLGRRYSQSLKDTLRAVTAPSNSVRAALKASNSGDSVKRWIATL